MLRIAHAGSDEGRSALLREAEAAAAVEGHPSFVQLRHAHLAAAVPFLVRDDLPATLATLPSTTPAAVHRSLLTDILDGLIHLDDCGLAHHRVDPHHVLVDWGGRARLCGLGNVAPADRTGAHGQASDAQMAAAVGRAFIAVATGSPNWQPSVAIPARRMLARRRPDLLRDDPVMVGVLDALLHPDEAVRLDLRAARALIARSWILLRP